MGNKKKTSRKMWKLAGEPVYSSMLSPSEERIFSEPFAGQDLGDSAPSIFKVPVSLMRLREEAARASREYFCRQFEGKYRREIILEALASAVSFPTMMAADISDVSSFLLGAALWVLDHTKVHGLVEELDALLPPEPSDEMFTRVPTVDDFTYSWTDILRVMTVLTERTGKHRKAFRGILNLVDKKTATCLRNCFREALLDYFDRFLEVCTRLKKPVEAVSYNQPPFTLPAAPPIGEFLKPAQPSLTPEEEYPDILFLMQSLVLVGASMEDLQEGLGSRRAAELLAGFSVRDPYAVCMAYVLLEKEGDALTALNMLTGAVAVCAERHLPWGCGEPMSYAQALEDFVPDYTLRYPFIGPEAGGDSEEEDMLPFLEIDSGQRLSEAQLFYSATGYALPRQSGPSRKLAGWFMKQGLPENRAKEFSWGAMISAYLDEWRDRDFWDRNFSWDEPDYEEEPVSETEHTESQAEQPTDTASVEELTRQLKNMRRALHETEQAAKRLQERLWETERQATSDRDELTQLRDTLFIIRSAEDSDELALDTGVELPYQTRRRILAFGGHDTWRKTIRPLLPNVRFIETDTLPDISAMKAADVIWLQTNAMSHKFYYRIIDTARKNGVPVRYFGFSSARKCAVQLVTDELTAEKKE